MNRMHITSRYCFEISTMVIVLECSHQIRIFLGFDCVQTGRLQLQGKASVQQYKCCNIGYKWSWCCTGGRFAGPFQINVDLQLDEIDGQREPTEDVQEISREHADGRIIMCKSVGVSASFLEIHVSTGSQTEPSRQTATTACNRDCARKAMSSIDELVNGKDREIMELTKVNTRLASDISSMLKRQESLQNRNACLEAHAATTNASLESNTGELSRLLRENKRLGLQLEEMASRFTASLRWTYCVCASS